MNYPSFFEAVEPIQVTDPLARTLGSIGGGEYEFTYTDVVKAAGHSCPTVAGAYLMTREALKRLYPGARAVRGEIRVEFKEQLEEGVAGVIGNVITQLTGATDRSGFKGLAGRFARHSLMHFGADIQSSARFTRVDTQRSVDVIYDPSSVPFDQALQGLFMKIRGGGATPEEEQTFGVLWQARVEQIFAKVDLVIELKEI